MVRPSKVSRPFWLAAVLLAVSLNGVLPAQAGVSSFAAGITLPQPIGNAALILNHPVGFQADAWFDGFAAMGDFLKFQVTGKWEPFKVPTLSNSNFNLFGLMGGLHAAGGPGFLGMAPFFSLQAGGVYESLSFSGAATGGVNSALSFAARIVPGLDVTLYRHLGLTFSFPLEIIFVKTPVPIWSSVFSVRWKL
jgi:hypothetical protein